MKSKLLAVVITLVGLALLAACAPVPVSQAPAPAETPAAAEAPAAAGPTGTLTIGVPVIIDTLDPTMSNNVNIENVGLTVMEGLTYLNENNEVEPMLAESWEIVDDNTYIFHLREGVTFHNGEPFNADSVIFTEKWVKDTKRGAQYPWETVQSIEKIDDYTIKITTKAPDPLFLKRMGVAAGSIYPPKYVQEVGDEGGTQKPVGTGPFVFKEWLRGEKVIFEANPNYWGGPDEAQVGTVVWKNIPEADARIAALETGEIDIALQVPAAQVGVLMDNSKLKVSRALSTRVFYMMFDNISSGKGTPIADKRVRQAMIHAVDRTAIIDAIFRGNGEVINSLVGNVQFGYDPSVAPLPYDPDKAKALLAEAGYPDGFKIGMSCPSGGYANDVEVCQAITGYLKDVGIEVDLQITDANRYWDLWQNHQLAPMAFDGAGDRFRDPQMALLAVKKTLPWMLWDDPEIHRMSEAAESTVDQEKRKEIFAELQRYMQDEPPAIPLWELYNFSGVNTRVDGFTPRPNETVSVRGVSVRE